MGWAISSGVAGAALWAVHGRMVVAVGVTAMAFLVAAKRRLPTASLLAGIAALATGLLATRPLQELARKRTYDGRRVDEAGAVLRGLDDPEAILAVLRNLVGHTWYLAVATAGLAAVVGLGAAQQGLGRRRTAVDAPSVLLLATTAGLLVISAAWFATVTRPDQLIYGRYVEPVTPVLVAVGLTRLSGASGRRTLSVVLPALGALTVVVAGLRAGVEVGEAPNRWNVAALPFLTSDLQPAVLMGAGLVAIAAGVALALAGARGPAAVALVAIAVFVPVTAVTQLRLVRRQEQRVYPSGWTTPASQLGTRVRFVGYDDDAGDSQSVKIYQWFMPTVRFRLYDGESEDPPVQHYFTTRAPRGSARPLWHDSGRGQTLWMMSSEPPRPGRRPAPAPSSGGGAWGKIAESGASLRGSRARQ
jgi:hypothetical protein